MLIRFYNTLNGIDGTFYGSVFFLNKFPSYAADLCLKSNRIIFLTIRDLIHGIILNLMVHFSGVDSVS